MSPKRRDHISGKRNPKDNADLPQQVMRQVFDAFDEDRSGDIGVEANKCQIFPLSGEVLCICFEGCQKFFLAVVKIPL